VAGDATGEDRDDVDGRLGRYYRVRPEDGWWWHRRPAAGPLADYLAGTD
jgi:hypothetical protein